MGDASGTAPYDTVEFNPLDPRGRTYINQVFSIRLEGARGPVVIGDRGRITNSHEREHTPFNQDHANTIQNSRTRPSTSGTTPQTSDTTASISEGNTHTQPEKPINQLSSYTSTDVNILYAKIGTPGGYCNRTYYQHSNVGDWNPRPINGILFQRGEIEFEWTVESFLENPERFIQEMDTCAGSVKKGKEQFILQGILPYLERYMWGKSSANNIDTYRVLAQASCCRSGDVVKHSLQQLLHFLYRDGLENYKQNLLSVEEIIRLSIVSPDGMLGNEAHPTQVLRLSVYGRILSEQVVHKIQTGFSRIDLKNILEELEEVKAFFNQITPQKKDILRYSMEFIQEAVSYLLPRSPTTHLARYLEECEAFCANSQTAVKKFLLFRRLMYSQVKWFDLHCVLHYLHGKLQNEGPTPEMHKERRAMILLRRVVEVYLDDRGGRDWRFCLLAATLLSDISMNNVTKEIRIEAGGCLVSLLKNKDAQKRPECRAILERLSKRVLFCQHSLIKKLLVPHLYDNQNTQDTLPAELLIEHLTNGYKTQILEINNPIIRQPDHNEPSFFVYEGTLKGQKVAVKILRVTKQDVLEGDLTEQSEGKERLIAEAYNLWKLNSLNRHQNIPVLLSYNTETLPYHIVTEYEKYGNLLQLVRKSREAQVLPSPVLYKMLIGITEGLLYLQGMHLVHRAVMAENVLVGDGHTCKLSGLHSLGMLGSYRPSRKAEGHYDYATVDDGFSECISENDESLPVRWKSPEVLQGHSYSTPSDVWAFGVLMYEVLTFGCLPYRGIGQDDQVARHVLQENDKGILPEEECFGTDEYKLMSQCWKRQRKERIKLFQLSEELKKKRLKVISGEPRPNPPALGLAIKNTQSPENGSELSSTMSVAGVVNSAESGLKGSRSAEVLNKPAKPGKRSSELLNKFESDPSLTGPQPLPVGHARLSAQSSTSSYEEIAASKEHIKSTSTSIRIKIPDHNEEHLSPSSADEDIVSDDKAGKGKKKKRKLRWKWSPFKKMKNSPVQRTKSEPSRQSLGKLLKVKGKSQDSISEEPALSSDERESQAGSVSAGLDWSMISSDRGTEAAVSFENLPSASSLEGLQAAHDRIKIAPKHRRPPTRAHPHSSSMNLKRNPAKPHRRSMTDPQDLSAKINAETASTEGLPGSRSSDIVNTTIFEASEISDEKIKEEIVADMKATASEILTKVCESPIVGEKRIENGVSTGDEVVTEGVGQKGSHIQTEGDKNQESAEEHIKESVHENKNKVVVIKENEDVQSTKPNFQIENKEESKAKETILKELNVKKGESRPLLDKSRKAKSLMNIGIKDKSLETTVRPPLQRGFSLDRMEQSNDKSEEKPGADVKLRKIVAEKEKLNKTESVHEDKSIDPKNSSEKLNHTDVIELESKASMPSSVIKSFEADRTTTGVKLREKVHEKDGTSEQPARIKLANRKSEKLSQLLENKDNKGSLNVETCSSSTPVMTTDNKGDQSKVPVKEKPKIPTKPQGLTSKKSPVQAPQQAHSKTSNFKVERKVPFVKSLSEEEKQVTNKDKTPSHLSAEKCAVCGRIVYQMEKCNFDSRVLHKQCVKCSVCKRLLTVGNFVIAESKVYCKPHGQAAAVTMSAAL